MMSTAFFAVSMLVFSLASSIETRTNGAPSQPFSRTGRVGPVVFGTNPSWPIIVPESLKVHCSALPSENDMRWKYSMPIFLCVACTSGMPGSFMAFSCVPVINATVSTSWPLTIVSCGCSFRSGNVDFTPFMNSMTWSPFWA